MVKNTNWDYASAKLQKAYDLAISASDDFSFYINLINYVALFDQITELQEFIKNYILKTAEKDNELLRQYESAIVKETLSIFDVVKLFIEKNKIATPELKECVRNIPLLYEEKIITSDGKMKAMFGNLNRILYILWELDNSKHKDFLLQFGKIDKEGNIQWAIMEKVDLYDVEELKVKRLGLIKIWYYWDKIAFFYNIFTEYEKMTKEWFEQKRFMTLMGIKKAYNELALPLGLLDRQHKPTPAYFFAKNNMYNALKQFHYHFLDAIDLIKRQKELRVKVKYKHTQQELTIQDTVISFKGSKRADLLELLFKKNSKIYFDEALEHIEGVDVSMCTPQELKSYKKRFINYCDGINNRAAKKGFIDFLFSDSNSVSINPLYK